MQTYFSVLTDEEYDVLKDAVSLITVYIAGADGKIDHKELEWAEKVTKIRAYNLPDGLKTFYTDVGVDYHDRLEQHIECLPSDTLSRQAILEEKLAKLNPIMAKLNPVLGAKLYKSYKSFAKHVGKADGGFLGVFSIGPKEAELIKLEMINPIEAEEL